MARHGGDAAAAMAATGALHDAEDESQRIEAMGLLIYSCAGHEVDRTSQSAAASGTCLSPFAAPAPLAQTPAVQAVRYRC